MAHEELVMDYMESMVIADKHVVADIMSFRNIWTRGTPAVNNSYKTLTNLTALNKLVKGDGYFKLPSCKSEYAEHAQLLTKAIAEIIKTNLVVKIIREATLNEIGLRPDAIALLKNGNKAVCFVLEVCNNETEEYLTQKINAWKHWEGGLEKLSEIFKTRIPAFDVVVEGNNTNDFKSYLEEVRQWHT
jgi:hypothetical protein